MLFTIIPFSQQKLCPPPPPPPPPPPSGVVSDSLSLPSYKDYPAHRPFINTLVHHTPQTRTHQSSRLSSPSKAFPETSSAGNSKLCVCVCMCVCVCGCFSFTKFPPRYCDVSALHGYSVCNLMPHYLNVSATLISIHSSSDPILLFLHPDLKTILCYTPTIITA